MKIVNEDTELVVGKMYNVRCAEVKNMFNHNTYAFVPVIGEKHKDPQFGVNFQHYHIDGRFAGENDIFPVDENGKTVMGVECSAKKVPAPPDRPLALVAAIVDDLLPVMNYSSKEAMEKDLGQFQDYVASLRVGEGSK